MKLIGNLKKKVENAKTKEEARDTIKKAGMLLDNDELDQVSGGVREIGGFSSKGNYCPYCKKMEPIEFVNNDRLFLTLNHIGVELAAKKNTIEEIREYRCLTNGTFYAVVFHSFTEYYDTNYNFIERRGNVGI